MSERTLQALRGRINARLQTSAISRDRASAAGREVVALCRQSDVETLEWVLSEIDALLRTPRGEGEAMDADEMWNHWTSGHEDAALLGLRTASDDEAHRFLGMLADWQRCPKPSDHDAIAALRSEASGQGGIHPDPETWRCRQCGGHAAHYRDCPALRSEAQGEGWQVAEPARDIVRREMPETRATVREAIRAARRGEGGGE